MRRQTLRGLCDLKQLTALWLVRTRVTDSGMAHLATLPALNSLVLDETQVSDVGLESVSKLTRLKSLSLRRKPGGNAQGASPAGVLCVWSDSELVSLHLDGTDVDDRGLAYLRGCSELFELDLSHTRVTPAGLRNLARLPKLRSLTIGPFTGGELDLYTCERCLL